MHSCSAGMCGHVGHHMPNKLYHCGGKPKDSDSPQAQFVGQVLSQHVKCTVMHQPKITFDMTSKSEFFPCAGTFSCPKGPSKCHKTTFDFDGPLTVHHNNHTTTPTHTPTHRHRRAGGQRARVGPSEGYAAKPEDLGKKPPAAGGRRAAHRRPLWKASPRGQWKAREEGYCLFVGMAGFWGGAMRSRRSFAQSTSLPSMKQRGTNARLMCACASFGERE